MGNISINLEEGDLEQLREQAKEARVPVTIYARMLLIQAMRTAPSPHELSEGTE